MATATATITSPITETYYDVEKLIYHVCNGFRREYGGDVEEMVGEANLVYMKVYKSWNSSGAMSFTSFLATCIYRKLLDKKRSDNKKSKVWNISLHGLISFEFETNRVFDKIMEDKKPTFDKDDFLEEFTKDAQKIIQFILEEPEELKLRVKQKGNQHRNWRSVIRNYLKEIGWTAKRITESFEEIRSLI